MGDRIGRLTLIEEVVRDSNDPIPYRRKARRFRFKCDCGNEVISAWKPLSCGCLQREKAVAGGKTRRKAFGEASFNALYVQYVNRSTRDGIEFRLSRDEFRCITSANCFYCDQIPTSIHHVGQSRKRFGDYLHNGVDRADCAGGYTAANSVPCCAQCNFAKHTTSQQDFYAWVQKVYLHLRAKGVF